MTDPAKVLALHNSVSEMKKLTERVARQVEALSGLPGTPEAVRPCNIHPLVRFGNQQFEFTVDNFLTLLRAADPLTLSSLK